MRKIKVGVIGLGYWGPSYVRNFMTYKEVDVTWACDLDENSLQTVKQQYPAVSITKDYFDLLKDKTLDLIAIATPPNSHFTIAHNALSQGKHVVIAKPITTNSKDALKLLRMAKKKRLLLHGDLTYLYTGAVLAIREFVKKGEIGKPLYYDSTRSNLGLIQKDVNVIWDLAPHDLGIIHYCFDLKPIKVFAVASNHVGKSENGEMAHITIHYSHNFIAHIHVSWLSPVKIRTVLLGGTKKMIFYNDIEPDEKVRIYDKGVRISENTATPLKPVYRSGDILIPKLNGEEALLREVEEIIHTLQTKKINYQNAELNIQIIKVLEACDRSLKEEKSIMIDRRL